MNNLFNFKGNEVEIFEYKGEILFNPRNIAKCIGITESTLRDHISKFTKTQVIKLKNKDISDVSLLDFRKLNNAGETFLTKEGLLTLISNCHTEEKIKVDFLKLLGYEDKIIVTTRDEIKFIEKLKNALMPFNIEGVKQYKVLNYRIDYYIPSLNIAIEYDENNHKNYTYEKHEGRQKEIEEKLGCRFIRISDDETDEYNIGLVIKSIFNL